MQPLKVHNHTNKEKEAKFYEQSKRQLEKYFMMIFTCISL